ncbi:hypothetical protein [Winogradskyella endarachnes]|uniref:Secretion system C-terminal sorting domain-containing protein n=1 Tax=Winogradskyella endarachnes TaxID=2681965 RepID=A0A6L6UBR9_9FLAO|nr:hypothetical protein [Winogradskyella endarachnes]MUU78976.1 hypothetical protein [Winogradskyella endarachnes]
MKTLFKNILVLAVMLGTCTSYANAALEVSPTFNNVNEGDLISVKDESGAVIYNGRINYNGNLQHLYDFSQLNDGTYKVEVNKDYEIVVNSVKVKNNIVTFIEAKSEKIFKPVFRTKDSKIIISKIAIDTNEMEVELYYENNLIHTETVTGEDILNRIYQLDNTQRGEYTAVIKSNDRVFVETFRI